MLLSDHVDSALGLGRQASRKEQQNTRSQIMNNGYTILLDMCRIETSIFIISQLGGLPCVAQSQEAVSVRDVYSGTSR
jgi:hypothetical protein